MRKKDAQKLLIRLIGPVIVVIVLFFIDVSEVIEHLVKLRWKYFLLSILLIPLLVFMRSIRWRWILQKLNIRLTHWDCYKICFASFAALAVVPAIGGFLKVFYCRNYAYGTPIISVVAEKCYDLIIPLVFGLVLLCLSSARVPTNFAFLIVIPFAFLAFYPSKIILRKSYSEKLSRFLERRLQCVGKFKLRSHFSALVDAFDLKIYVLSMAVFISGAYIRVYLIALALSLDFRFLEVALIMSVTSLVTLVPISYFGIGAMEVGLIGSFEFFGYSIESAIALSVGLLCFRVVLVLLGGMFLFFHPLPVGRRNIYELIN